MAMIAGKYYIGDLCYVMHDVWSEVCDLLFAGRADHGCNEGEFTLKDGRRFAIYNTAHGDGTYEDQYGREYSVDSGSIGCILFDDIRDNTYGNIEELGNISEFNLPFETMGDDGVIKIGSIEIDTGWYPTDDTWDE